MRNFENLEFLKRPQLVLFSKILNFIAIGELNKSYVQEGLVFKLDIGFTMLAVLFRVTATICMVCYAQNGHFGEF